MIRAKALKRAHRRALRQPLLVVATPTPDQCAKMLERLREPCSSWSVPLIFDSTEIEVELHVSFKSWARFVASPADDLGRAATAWLERKGLSS